LKRVVIRHFVVTLGGSNEHFNLAMGLLAVWEVSSVMSVIVLPDCSCE